MKFGSKYKLGTLNPKLDNFLENGVLQGIKWRHFPLHQRFKPWGVLHIFWVRGRAIRKGIDFHDFGIRNGTGVLFQKISITFLENWYKERVCF